MDLVLLVFVINLKPKGLSGAPRRVDDVFLGDSLFRYRVSPSFVSFVFHIFALIKTIHMSICKLLLLSFCCVSVSALPYFSLA